MASKLLCYNNFFSYGLVKETNAREIVPPFMAIMDFFYSLHLSVEEPWQKKCFTLTKPFIRDETADFELFCKLLNNKEWGDESLICCLALHGSQFA